MYLAIIGDVLSNFSGLERVLDAIADAGIYRVIHTGNISKDGLHAAPCIALLRARGVVCVQGSLDRAFVREGRKKGRDGSEREASRERHPLDSVSLEYLNTLPRKRVLTEEGLRILVCHGSINSPATLLDSHTPQSVFQRQRELDPANVIICGGAAEPFQYLADDSLCVMPGRMTSDSGAVRYTVVDTEVLPPSARTVTL